MLVVEDEAQLRKRLVDKFVAEEFQTIEAADGGVGLTLALSERPDIIVLDILMPRIDGIAMLKKLREDEWGKSVPVVLLTNLTPDSEQLNEAISTTDPAFFLIKSELLPGDIVEKVRQRLLEDEPTA